MKDSSQAVAASGASFTQPVARTPSQTAVLRRIVSCRTILETTACPHELRKGAQSWSMEGLKVQRVLGEGALSTVVHATCTATGLPLALKIYHRDRLNSLNVRQISREIEIHASLSHHVNVIKLYAAFEDADGVYLVQEYAAGGDLYAELSRHGGHMLEAHVVKAVMVPFLQAVAHMHSQGILHRDIKPENILLTGQGEIKVADFGLAIDTLKEKPMSRVGTLDYMPPEIAKLPRPGGAPSASQPSSPAVRHVASPTPSRFASPQPIKSCAFASPSPQPSFSIPAGASVTTTPCSPSPLGPAAAAPAQAQLQNDQQNYGLPVDVWCTGILAYELLVGAPPFEAETKEATYSRIINLEPFYPDCFSREAKDFIKKALEKDPQRRPTASQLLSHPWLRSGVSARSVHASPTAGIVVANTPSHLTAGTGGGNSETTDNAGFGGPSSAVLAAYLAQIQTHQAKSSTSSTTAVVAAGTVEDSAASRSNSHAPLQTSRPPASAATGNGARIMQQLSSSEDEQDSETVDITPKSSSHSIVLNKQNVVNSSSSSSNGEILIPAAYGDAPTGRAAAFINMLRPGSSQGIPRTKSRFLSECFKKLSFGKGTSSISGGEGASVESGSLEPAPAKTSRLGAGWIA